MATQKVREASTSTADSETVLLARNTTHCTALITTQELEKGESQRDAHQQQEDPIFGNEDGADVHYRTCEWWHAAFLMMADTISLGAMALPQAVETIGLVPGIIILIGLGILATYTGYIIGQFKLAYPAMHSFADCGELIAGPVGGYAMAFAQVFILVFIMAAHLLSFAIAINVISEHANCTVLFSFGGLVISFFMGLPRTLRNVSYYTIVSGVSIIVAIIVAMYGIAVARPDMGNILPVQAHVPLVEGLAPVNKIILAYSGHVAYFTFCAELKNPRSFTKALAFQQVLSVAFYLTVSMVMYYYAGAKIASPALASASPLIRKVSFGLALPSIVVAGVVNGTVACKYVYLRLWSGTDMAHRRTWSSVGSWVGVCAGLWSVAFIIAESVPSFSLLLGLIGAVFCSWFSYGLPGLLWLYMNKGRYLESRRKMALTALNICIFAAGAAMCGLGLWSSGTELRDGKAGEPFTCADTWSPVFDL